MKRTILSVLVAVMMMVTAVGMSSISVEAAGKKTTTSYSSSKKSSKKKTTSSKRAKCRITPASETSLMISTKNFMITKMTMKMKTKLMMPLKITGTITIDAWLRGKENKIPGRALGLILRCLI